MTTHNSFPLRGGKAWPGVDTLGGKLDDGSGQMTDRSKNVMVNTADILSKRKGFVRGLDEQFSGPVCGLHRYTDECGIEYLLVADENQIHIREPFHIPVFEVSDAYPNDGFSGTTASVDLSRWRDPSLGYRHLSSRLVLRNGVLNPQPLEWFKEATSLSYGVETKYTFPNEATNEEIKLYIKSAQSDGDGSLLLRIQNNGGTLTCAIFWVSLDGTEMELEFARLLGSSLSGDVTRFQYDEAQRRVRATVFVDGNGTPAELEATLTVAQAADLGQKSLIQLNSSSDSECGLEEISGGPV